MDADEITTSNLIDQLASIRFGNASSQTKKRLERDLKRFRRVTNAEISETAIENWFRPQGADPLRARSIGFLHDYFTHNVKKGSLSAKNQQELYGLIEEFLRPPAYSKSPSTQTASSPVERHDSFVTAMINMILEKGNRGDERELDDFFYCSPSASRQAEDQSYYAMYRHSTTGGILNTFLVLKKPLLDMTTFYSFVMFVRGGPEFHPDVVRESQGLILKYDSCYQLFGYTYRLPNDDARGRGASFEQRLFAKTQPRALEIIALEYADINLDRGLFSGAVMTIGAQNQPVLARGAFLHLGTSQSMKRIISDKTIEPTEMRVDELSEDLRKMVARLQGEGTERFPGKLGREVLRPDWMDVGAKTLAEEILTMTDNAPAWETSPANKDRVDAPHGRGAIETFSKSGNRPRP
jgi:hypothetical protein